MKLLVVDDEELTRSGLLSSIPWPELGITELYQAADGIQGLQRAREHRPDILLCDVRMPRMDGIQMAKELLHFLPDCAIIFMSGYSDKEYLKAAIRLKAICYVEKPLNADEIREAVLEASQNCRERENAQIQESRLRLQSAARLALLLTAPYEKNRAAIAQLWDSLKLPPPEGLFFTPFLVKLAAHDLLSDDFIYAASDRLACFLKPYGLFALLSGRYQGFLVVHICGGRKLSVRDRDEILAFLRQDLAGRGDYYITCGACQDKLGKLHSAYETSVLLMENCFFFEPGSSLTPDDVATTAPGVTAGAAARPADASRPAGAARPATASRPAATARPATASHLAAASHLTTASHLAAASRPAAAVSPTLLQDFTDALLLKDEKKAEQKLEQIYQFYFHNLAALSDPAKETYYRLITDLDECRIKLKLPVATNTGTAAKTVIRYLEEFFSLDDLHQALLRRTRQWFHDLRHQTEDPPTIYRIKCYIRDNYMDETISVKDISEHVHLTASYLCTMFKAECGQTLNQYITECRIERAKQYLRDPLYKITEIAPLVGYSDSNYFSKSFKKTVGASPSEYREKWMI